MKTNKQDMLSRVTRDIADGLIVLDMHGVVSFVNSKASKLLEHDPIQVGEKYAKIMMDDFREENDQFHQFLLDSIYDKRKIHHGRLSYTCPNGNKKIFDLTCSFLFGEDEGKQEGVVIQFSDVTKEAELAKYQQDTATGFVLLLMVMCIWIFFYALWQLFGQPIKGGVMTIIIEAMSIAGFLFLKRFTNIKLSPRNTNVKEIKKAILVDSFATLLILIGMVIIKLAMIHFNPASFGGNAKILDFSTRDIFDTFYPITVVLQEFLSRGVVHEAIKNMIPGKHANKIAIALSSLFFGALHVYLGLPQMIASSLLLGVFGVIYTKQKTIWGLCVPHYFLGIATKIILGI